LTGALIKVIKQFSFNVHCTMYTS